MIAVRWLRTDSCGKRPAPKEDPCVSRSLFDHNLPLLTVLKFHHDLVWARLTLAVSRYLLVLPIPDHHGLGRHAMALEPVRTSGVL